MRGGGLGNYSVLGIAAPATSAVFSAALDTIHQRTRACKLNGAPHAFPWILPLNSTWSSLPTSQRQHLHWKDEAAPPAQHLASSMRGRTFIAAAKLLPREQIPLAVPSGIIEALGTLENRFSMESAGPCWENSAQIDGFISVALGLAADPSLNARVHTHSQEKATDQCH